MKVGPDCPGLIWATGHKKILLHTNKPVGPELLIPLLLLKTPIRAWKLT